MKITVDLHSHSGYAGGAGSIDILSISKTMHCKGIDVYGIGDCLFAPWHNEYMNILTELSNGLMRLDATQTLFMRQTEVIITVRLKGHDNRIIAHHIILLPDDNAVQNVQRWMVERHFKNTIARPFWTFETQNELEHALFEIKAIDPFIEIIPAHIMTPDGILGSKNGLRSWDEFYGTFSSQIYGVESGLSADPLILSKIPDLQGKTIVSNSDCHSSALNRVGREFTILECTELSFQAIIEAIRKKRVILTNEFNPKEGRYFLTGHRADRHFDKKAVYFDGNEPMDMLCPLCHKKMIAGVKTRANTLSDNLIMPDVQRFIQTIPLIEVLAYAMKLKSIDNKRIQELYFNCIDAFGNEINLWQSTPKTINEKLDNIVPQQIINHIISILEGDFNYEPPGFDGQYGILRIRNK